METRREKKRTILTIPRSLWFNRKSRLVNTQKKTRVRRVAHG